MKQTNGQALLDINGIGISFGGLKAVQNFTMRIPRGGLYGLIGPNGAGKTTVFNLLTGVYKPQTGTITLDGVSLNEKKPFEIAAAGLSRSNTSNARPTKATTAAIMSAKAPKRRKRREFMFQD